MRLFHVSEESDIEIFVPRILKRRSDIKQGNGLVWAVTEERIYNFLFPRECPRVSTFKSEDENYLKDSDRNILVGIENDWVERINECNLYIYEFDIKNFLIQDKIAGYYVSSYIEKPINKYKVADCFKELEKRNVQVTTLDSLWELKNEIYKSTKNYSFCKIINAKKKGVIIL